MTADLSPAANRWQRESAFFDRWAERAPAAIAPVDPLAIARYRGPHLRKRFNKEFRFALLGDLAGRRILDVGCGEGGNSVLLAGLGAMVTGIDVSPGAIDVARRRAAVSGVGPRAAFHCTPVELFDGAGGPFDIIWGDDVLHHLIADLDAVLAKLAAMARPGTLVVFNEPVNLSRTLRRIRFLVPVHTEATPDERPLERAELAVVGRHLPDVRLRYFRLLGRLDRCVLTRQNYERSAWPRRALSNAMALADRGLLSLPPLERLAGQAVMYGHFRSPLVPA